MALGWGVGTSGMPMLVKAWYDSGRNPDKGITVDRAARIHMPCCPVPGSGVVRDARGQHPAAPPESLTERFRMAVSEVRNDHEQHGSECTPPRRPPHF